MEQKHVLLSALSAGVGVCMGLGLASGQSISRWTGGSPDGITVDEMEQELRKLVADGRDGNVSFGQFPYFLSGRTRDLLTSAACVHLKNADFARHTRNLSPASRSILLSGPSEIYNQTLAKALAHHFESKLLLLDVTDFSLKIQSKYGCSKKAQCSVKSISEVALDQVSSLFGSLSALSLRQQPRGASSCRGSGVVDVAARGPECCNNHHKLHKNGFSLSDANNIDSHSQSSTAATSKGVNSWCFNEKLFMQSLYKVLVSISEQSSVVLYLRDVEKFILQSTKMYDSFSELLKKLSGSVLILGSKVLDVEDEDEDGDSECRELDERLSLLFPYNFEIIPMEDETQPQNWRAQLEEDMKKLQYQDNKNYITEVLSANDIECADLGSICSADTLILSNYLDEIIISAISHHLMHNKYPEYRNGKLIISSDSLSHGLSIIQGGKVGSNVEENKATDNRGRMNAKSVLRALQAKKSTHGRSVIMGRKDEGNRQSSEAPELPPDNEFEKRIRHEVISANQIGVKFSDIGALDEIKESLQELVMLPIRRPHLFKGGLLKPCRGILLFGPPGTGKTMLAKATAREAGASFINVSMSTITSKWFGEDEKNIRAVFSLAVKVSPSIIFIDEVDSMLGQRARFSEHEAMRKIKNEFMTHWDGLLTKSNDRILVLAATNRPFDLDEAIIRRFERRIMVGLPSVKNREEIIRTLLAQETTDGIDFKEVASMTEGYSGSDLKTLCTTAAYRPLRELMQQERLKEKERKENAVNGGKEKPEEEEQQNERDGENKEELGEDNKNERNDETKAEEIVTLRPLNMEDFRHAQKQVSASFATEGYTMKDLTNWNDLYGEGGSRKKQQLPYFL